MQLKYTNYNIHTNNQHELEEVEQILNEAGVPDNNVAYRIVTDSTYEKICELTSSKKRAGQLNYRLGHPGLGVAFASGYGDGTYEVFATYDDDGTIVKVEIELA